MSKNNRYSRVSAYCVFCAFLLLMTGGCAVASGLAAVGGGTVVQFQAEPNQNPIPGTEISKIISEKKDNTEKYTAENVFLPVAVSLDNSAGADQTSSTVSVTETSSGLEADFAASEGSKTASILPDPEPETELSETAVSTSISSSDSVRPFSSQAVINAAMEIPPSDDVPESDVKEDAKTAFESRFSLSTPAVIAHAGGGVVNLTYTNSLEAMNKSYFRGVRMFEIDFSVTADNEIICVHDFSGWVLTKYFGVSENETGYIPTFHQWHALSMLNGMTQMDIYTVTDWLRSHSDAVIVTDVKAEGQNIEYLKLIAERFPDMVSAFIPQIYSFEEYEQARELGYENIILTLYRAPYKADEVLEFAEEHKLFCITAFNDRFTDNEIVKIAGEQRLFLHTINDPEEARRFIELGVSGIYSDFLVELNQDYQ